MFKAQFSYLDAMVLVAVGFTGGKFGPAAMAGAVVVGAIATVLIELAWGANEPRPPEGRQ